MAEPRAKAQALVRLATNDGASPEEARTAAMQAARLIAAHDLLAGLERPTVTEWPGGTADYWESAWARDWYAQDDARARAEARRGAEERRQRARQREQRTGRVPVRVHHEECRKCGRGVWEAWMFAAPSERPWCENCHGDDVSR